MRKALNKLAVALLVALLLAQQLPVPSLAYATEGTSADTQEAKAGEATEEERASDKTSPTSEGETSPKGNEEAPSEEQSAAEGSLDERDAEQAPTRSAKAPTRAPSTHVPEMPKCGDAHLKLLCTRAQDGRGTSFATPTRVRGGSSTRPTRRWRSLRRAVTISPCWRTSMTGASYGSRPGTK